MQTIINNQLLVSLNVSLNSSRFSNTILYNNYHYEFPKVNDNSYPLELAITQLPALNKYDLIILENIEKDGFIVVFKKTPTRKSILIEKAYFISQLVKFKELFENIAIINSTDVYDDKANEEIFKDKVDFVAIEKLPILIDPNKKKILIKKYSIFILLVIILNIFLNFHTNSLNQELSISQEQLKNETLLFEELTKKIKNKQMPMIPSKNVQKEEMKNTFILIDRGAI